MTILVASLFLPYTVQFEVESLHAVGLNEDDSIGEIVEHSKTISLNPEVTQGKQPCLPDDMDSSISIIQSLANNHSTLSLQDSIHSNNDNSEYHFQNTPDDHIDNLSISTASTPEIPNTSLAYQSSLKTSTPKSNVSVQDFFFNNPYTKNKFTSSTASLEEQLNNPTTNTGTGNKATGLSSNAPSASSMISQGNVIPGTFVSKFIKPKVRIRSTTPQPTVSELSTKKPLMEPKLASMRINRSSYLNRRTINSSTSFSADKKVDSSSSTFSGEILAEASPDPVNLERLEKEQDEFLDDYFHEQNRNSKIAPYGGFSRPHKDLLENNNVFGTAPWKVVDFAKGNGSLKNAVELARSKNGEDFKWVGTVSMPSDVVPKSTREKITKELSDNYHSDAIFFEDEVFQGHYYSFSKQILWPIFHYQIPDNPKSNAFENHSWNDYEEINRLFAERIVSVYKEGDTIWIHDYHLMLLPEMLRKKLPHAKIAFFLHVSFPSSEVFRCLAQRKRILEGMLGADCISFQTDEYVGHFFQSCNRLLLADFDDCGVYYQNRTTRVSSNPIGLDFNYLNAQLQSDVVQRWRQLVRERWKDKKLIVSRETIDKIRGIKEKLLAYERFLDNHPDYINITILILICLKTKGSDDDFENEIFSIVERINSKTNNISIDQPIIVLNQDIEFEQYLGLLAEADMFVVSTLREGMNLICHEFICAAQQSCSPLILSEFVGSASVLTKGPILTNPYNVKQVSEKLYEALNMPDTEKQSRWQSTFKDVLKHDSQTWIKDCLNDVNQAFENSSAQRCGLLKPLTKSSYDSTVKSIDPNSKRLFILNLDNLSANLEIQGQKIHALQQQLINTTIGNLASNPRNVIYIISFYQRADLLRKYRRVADIGFIAENGGYIKPPTKNEWYTVIDETELTWMPTVIDVMKSFSERIPGSYIEVEECTVRFHTEATHDIERDHMNSLVGDLITHINELYSKEFNVHANLVQGILIVQEMNLIDRALSFVMNQNEFVGSLKIAPSSSFTSPLSQPTTSSLCISPSLSSILPIFGLILTVGGSSPIDEETFGYFKDIPDPLPANIMCVKVGQSRDQTTNANLSLQGINELLIILGDKQQS